MKTKIAAALLSFLALGFANAGSVNSTIVPTLNMASTCSVGQSTYAPVVNSVVGVKPETILTFVYTCTAGLSPTLTISPSTQNFNGTQESLLTATAYVDSGHTQSYDTPQPLRAIGSLDSVDVYLQFENAVTHGPVNVSGSFTFPALLATIYY